ncbi:hypothetical protein CWN68_22840 [Klebsiella michiganensis]|nr:hypothetical protein CWN68_22840 [Klebsiella michiganensis]
MALLLSLSMSLGLTGRHDTAFKSVPDRFVIRPSTSLSMLQVTNERLLPLTDFQPSLVKFVADEFVTSMPPLSNANYLGYIR